MITDEEIEKLKAQNDEHINYLLGMEKETKDDVTYYSTCARESEEDNNTEDLKYYLQRRDYSIGGLVKIQRILHHIAKRL